MADLTLKRIKIRNWTTIRNAEVEFPASGLVLVTGSNLASGGKMESVGSGKTALGEALCRTLCGVAGRYATYGHYSSNQKGNTYLAVEALLGGKPLLIESGYKCPEISSSGEGLRYSLDGAAAVERGHLRETRDELTTLVRMPPDLATWSVYIDGDKLKFDSLSEKTSVDLLMTALAQPPWTAYHANVAKMVTGARQNVAVQETAHATAKSNQVILLDQVASARRMVKDEEDRVAEASAQLASKMATLRKQSVAAVTAITAEEKKMSAIKKDLTRIENESAAEHHQLEIRANELNEALRLINDEHDERHDTFVRAKSDWNAEKGVLREMKAVPKDCPTCSKPWDKVHSHEALAAQEVRVANKDDVMQAADKAKQATQERRVSKTTQLNEVNLKRRKLTSDTGDTKDLSLQYEDCETEVRRQRRLQQQADVALAQLEGSGVDKSALARTQAVLEERQGRVAAGEKAVAESAEQLMQFQETLKVLAYWLEAFGPTGIPNMVLRDSIQPLNDVARRISNLLTGGSVQIKFSTSRELASGREKAELVTTVENKLGASRAEGSSKGESGLINLIVAETLSEVGCVSNRIGFRWYDEILVSQDATVRRSILAYLKDTARRLGILVFVVDHHMEASSYADHVLVAEKTDKGTTFHWK